VPVQLFEIRWRGFGCARTKVQQTVKLKSTEKAGTPTGRLEKVISMLKASLRKTHDVLAEVKGGYLDKKREKQEKKAEALAVDFQCGEIRKRVKYSSNWQKMKTRIMQEFHLKWKRWVLFKYEAEHSIWEKLPPPYGSLKPEGMYKIVIHSQDRNKKARPGKIKRRERRQATGQSPTGVKKLQSFMWTSGEQKPVKLSQPPHITIQKRQPSPPLEIVKRAKVPVYVSVNTNPQGEWRALKSCQQLLRGILRWKQDRYPTQQ
jgi:hypothetical protein